MSGVLKTGGEDGMVSCEVVVCVSTVAYISVFRPCRCRVRSHDIDVIFARIAKDFSLSLLCNGCNNNAQIHL